MTELITPTRSTKGLRRVLVLMHMTTAFGWLTSSLAVLLLTAHGLAQQDQAGRVAVFETVAHLDDNLLADFSFMTVYTGLMLAGLTQWGYFRFWWVTVKLVLALTCALAGRAMFTRWLADAGAADHRLTAATILMITAISIMAWIARAKPWGRISGRGPARPWGHPLLYVVIIVTPVLDYITDLPLQAIPAAIVLGHHARRTLSAA